jgi:hypothetical protein
MESEAIKLPTDVVEIIKDIEPIGVNLDASTFGRKTAIRNLNNIIQKGVIDVPCPELLIMYKDNVGIQLEFEDKPRKVRNIIVEKENYDFLKRVLLSKGYEEKSERYFQKGSSEWYVFPLDTLF